MTNHSDYLSPLRGWLLFLALLGSLLVGFGGALSVLLPGLLLWLVGVSLFPSLNSIQKVQTLVILALGLAAMGVGLWRGAEPGALTPAIHSNHALISMLMAVTFLRLVASLRAAHRSLPVGRPALWQTLLGVHLFGAVINMSAVFIIGDRLARRGRISSLQARLLSRGFSLAAHWSPFFVAMGVALTESPGARMTTLSLVGLPVAMLGLWVAGAGLAKRPGVERLRGYPMTLDGLFMPMLLALGVVVLRQLLPEVSVIVLVSALSLVVTMLMLTYRSPRTAAGQFFSQITQQLPRMGGEVVLFLSAGVLSVGISVLVPTLGLALQQLPFTALEAAVLLVAMVGLAVLGVHPLISISAASGFLGVVSDPNLLGLTFLMTWALGVAASPLSGMHMAMQGRYGVPAYRFVGWNARYVLVMLVIDVGALFTYQALTEGHVGL